ncbi:hypothetical protein BD779DRAFT_1453336 [Infundibulicybe gibba]|nr:hypothetical protein BD779DRAFT_1453336 [Infundibulicybe gibba]
MTWVGSRARKGVSVTQLGHGIRKVVTLFEDLASLVRVADDDHLGVDAGGSDIDSTYEEIRIKKRKSVLSKVFQQRSLAAYDELLRLIPNFEKKLTDSSPEELLTFYGQLQRGASDARSKDTFTMKAVVANWLNMSTPVPNPILDPTCRLNRGIQHNTTGRLLCPIDFDWDDEVVRQKLQSGVEDWTSSFLAHCFYAGGSGDINNIEKGFLRSLYLVKTFQTLFTSPSSAQHTTHIASDDENTAPTTPAPPRKKSKQPATRTNVATVLCMNGKVTPRAIAYAAVQLHFALTDTPQWTDIHHNFDYQGLYNFIIDFFEDVDGPDAKQFAKNLLGWWNKYVFASPHLVIYNH